jgi:hypothetical protein
MAAGSGGFWLLSVFHYQASGREGAGKVNLRYGAELGLSNLGSKSLNSRTLPKKNAFGPIYPEGLTLNAMAEEKSFGSHRARSRAMTFLSTIRLASAHTSSADGGFMSRRLGGSRCERRCYGRHGRPSE